MVEFFNRRPAIFYKAEVFRDFLQRKSEMVAENKPVELPFLFIIYYNPNM